MIEVLLLYKVHPLDEASSIVRECCQFGVPYSTYGDNWLEKAFSKFGLALETTPDADIQLEYEGLQTLQVPRVRVLALELTRAY